MLAPSTTASPTYADIQALPPHLVGEILDGRLIVSPRPAGPHAVASTALTSLIGPPFLLGRGGPGGWWILQEPELSLDVDPAFDPVVPDLAGWRLQTLPDRPTAAQFTIRPDWVCKIQSPGTARHDRMLKLPFYARAGIRHAWLVEPIAETVEVFELRDGSWTLLGVYGEDQTVALTPFEAIEIPLSYLWGRSPGDPPDAPST